MLGAEHGFARAISEVVGGLIVSVLLGAFASTELIPSSYLLMFELLNLVLTISFVLAVPYWGTGYLFGWLFGLAIMSQSGLVGPLDFVVYFAIPLIVLVVRVLKRA
jgi:hypothetical protein